MKRTSQKGLTPLELRIMQAIWRAGGGTVADVQSRLEPEMAYTTVQTMLNILVRKGKLKRALDGRAERVVLDTGQHADDMMSAAMRPSLSASRSDIPPTRDFAIDAV